jgi:3-hydroxyisobutyrate dehydrogenase-like beta-hydroxyacid dehydrogenase
MNIGWIGLGVIGTQMAKRLLAAGHAVMVYGRGAGLAEALGAGASQTKNYAELAAKNDLLILCLFDDKQVRDVLFDQGALQAMKPGSVLAIHTTGSPRLSREAGERAPKGVDVLDATFSGWEADVAAGRLTVMVGGKADVLERAKPAFQAYAAHIHHVGPLGHGQTVKLLNNLIFATNLMNATEILNLAKGYGLETTVLAEVIQACSGGSYAMNIFKGAPVAAMMNACRPYLEKDVAMAVSAADESGLDISVFKATEDYFRKR